MGTMTTLRGWARGLKREIAVLWFAARHPNTPWYARLAAGAVLAYALSPIDLIPDFIPVLGLLDDLLLVPIGLALVVRLIPAAVLTECRERAAAEPERRAPASILGAAAIVALWLAAVALAIWWWQR